MIGKVTKGNGVPKLLWYLWGPGRANEHINPHLIASWDPHADLAALEPEKSNDRHDIRTLAQLLEQPIAAQTRLPTKAVWQCSLRLAPEDRPLTDAEWDHAAREVLHRTGFAPRDDPDSCRWIAMRHGPDHIHLVVTLARQDGQRVDIRNDYYKLGEACRDLERHHDLRRTNPRNRTGPRRPSRSELEKAHRHGKAVTPRDELRRDVRLAALATDTPQEFFDRLRQRGVLVRPRYSQQAPTVITGYSVAWPGNSTADGRPVWFGGSKLSADLSWTRLQEQWKASFAPSLSKDLIAVGRGSSTNGHDVAALLDQVARGLASRRHSNIDLEALERATVTLLLVLAGQRARGGGRSRAAVLRDRALPRRPDIHRSGSSDWLNVTLVASWVLRHPPKGAHLRGLRFAADRLLQTLQEATNPGGKLATSRPRREAARRSSVPHT